MSIAVFGQFDPQYSHNMFNQMTVNPGYAGSSDMIGITALNRNQWMGAPKAIAAPTDQCFTVNAPLNLFDKSWGVGLSILQNSQGISKDIGAKASFAYQHKVEIGDGKVGFGLSMGILNDNADYTKLIFGDGTKPTNLSGKKQTVLFDLGAGVYYKTDKVYLGVSTTHITSGNVYNSTTNLSVTRDFYITAGYNYQLTNPMYMLEPSVFVQTVGGLTTLNVNTNLTYNNRIWGGMSLRSNGDITGLFGLELMTGIKFGAAYDFSAGQVGAISHNSFEVIVMYNFKLKKEKIPQRYKSIRFL
jgi:type IX secretion system PorP/SprF family membrane protein